MTDDISESAARLAARIGHPARREKPVMDLRCLDDASYVLGALTPAERREFQWHLTQCPRCQASVRRLTQVRWLLAETQAHADDYPGRA
jgi:hypothetical protein